MVRKRLGDLLREEAQRTLEDIPAAKLTEVDGTGTEGESINAAQPQEVNSEAPKISALRIALQQAQEHETALQQEVVSLRSVLDARAQLEAQVADLQKTLGQMQQQEMGLQDEIVELRSLLEAKTQLEAQVSLLQTQLNQAQGREAALHQELEALQSKMQAQATAMGQLQAELETAKQTALKLAQVNQPKPAASRPAIVPPVPTRPSIPIPQAVIPRPIRPAPSGIKPSNRPIHPYNIVVPRPIRPAGTANDSNLDVGWSD